MRFKKQSSGGDYPPAHSSYEHVMDVDTITQAAESPKQIKPNHSANDVNTNRPDALTWQTTACIAAFFGITMVIYLTWFEYVKPDPV
jgi:hypothetical protein